MPDLVPTTTQWTPPQAKWVRRIVTGGGIFALVAVAAFIINKTVPSITSAVDLLAKLTSSTINLALTGAALAVVVWLLNETFSPKGQINKLFAMQYSSFINKLTWTFLEIDPLSPYYDRQKEVRAYKVRFVDAVGRLDGIMSRWRETAAKYRKDAATAEKEAATARAAAVKDPKYNNTFQIKARSQQRCLDTALEFEGYIQRLEPVRTKLHKTVEAAEMVEQNLALDVRIARDKWDAKGAFEEVNKTGRALFRGSEKAALAAQAAELIDLKYASELGLLENLATTTDPLLEMIELEKIGAGEALLAKWEGESTKLIEGPKAAPVATQESAGFRSLIQ